MNRLGIKIALVFIIGLFTLAVICLKPIDRTPFISQNHWIEWKKVINLTYFHAGSTGIFSAGWSKVNITPNTPGPLAGYGSRIGKKFTSIADSIYVRTIIIDNGHNKLALVSADLLIIPPKVTELVALKASAIGFSKEEIYLAATHSHNSIGGWYDSLVGYVFAGSYDQKVENEIAESIILSIKNGHRLLSPVEISFETDVDSTDILNRIELNGAEDPFIRSLNFQSEKAKATLLSYGAHPTVLSQKNLSLSRDYPGVIMDSLNNYDFSMFMAGAVGSMGARKGKSIDTVSVKEIGSSVTNHFLKEGKTRALGNLGVLWSKKIKLPMPIAAPRISKYFTLRAWLFDWLFGKSETYIQVAKIGNVLMIGMPCDFSGELVKPLEDLANAKGYELMFTSFNGGYVGYITADKHYEERTYETYIMNWYGPNNGAYFSAAVKDIITKIN